MPKIIFELPNGSSKEVEISIGETILEAAHRNKVDLEGACEGSLACSTCHVIVHDSYFDRLSEPSEEEEDMLDLAFGLTSTSRLGCQVVMSEGLDGLKVRIPKETRNISVDKE